MRLRALAPIALSACLLTAPASLPARAQNPEPYKATLAVRSDQPAAVINRNIYGHFAEHLGRLIYGGLRVGEGSGIPNTRGLRDDVVAALKELRVPVLRRPGGCFADEYRRFATFVKDHSGNRIRKLAVGSHDDNYNWTEVLMSRAAKHMDGLSLHYYTLPTSDAVVAGVNLNVFNRHADRVRMVNVAQVLNVLQAMILTDGERMVLTPTYHVFRMYRVHQGATLIPTGLTAPEYRSGPAAVPSLSVSASRDAEGPARFDGHRLQGSQLTLSVPAKSVVVLELR